MFPFTSLLFVQFVLAVADLPIEVAGNPFTVGFLIGFSMFVICKVVAMALAHEMCRDPRVWVGIVIGECCMLAMVGVAIWLSFTTQFRIHGSNYNFYYRFVAVAHGVVSPLVLIMAAMAL